MASTWPAAFSTGPKMMMMTMVVFMMGVVNGDDIVCGQLRMWWWWWRGLWNWQHFRGVVPPKDVNAALATIKPHPPLMCFRGGVVPKDVNTTIATVKTKKSIQFISGVMWCRRMWMPQLQRSRQNGQSSLLIGVQLDSRWIHLHRDNTQNLNKTESKTFSDIKLQQSRQNGQSSLLIGVQLDSRCLQYHLHCQCINNFKIVILIATIILNVTIPIIPISMDLTNYQIPACSSMLHIIVVVVVSTISFVIPINFTAGIIIGTNLIKKTQVGISLF